MTDSKEFKPTIKPPQNLILPLEVANIVLDRFDCTLALMDQSDQIYAKAIDGKGTLHFRNGNVYEGDLENGMLQGHGKLIWTNGVCYEGHFQYNQITGEGKYEWPDGSWYSGSVKQGLRHGKGTYCAPGDECIYSGDWVNGVREGFGEMKFNTGAVYVGHFSQGKKHGKGKMTYPSGNYYDGEWNFDQKHGKGVMHWENAGEKYSGEWRNNKQHGWGIHIWLEAKGEGKFLRNRYEGMWREGSRHGLGVFYYSNGSKYEGEWVDGFKDGFAIYTYEDGKIFKGYFEKDKMIPNDSSDQTAKKATLVHIGQQVTAAGSIMNLNDSAQSSPNKPKTLIQTQELKSKNPTLNTLNNRESKPQLKTLKSQNLSDQNFNTAGSLVPISEEPEANPYENLIDMSDLLVDEDDLAFENKEVKNLLLRHHSDLKEWYKHYTSKQIEEVEESFSMSSKLFWKLLRDTKVLTPKASIAAINRVFLRGSKNLYTLSTTPELLARKLKFAKKDYFESNDKDSPESPQLKGELEKGLNFTTEMIIDVQDENRLLLFRQYVDALVRVAYLKYGGAPGFAKNIERVLDKISFALKAKKKKGVNHDDEDILHRTKPVYDNNKAKLKEIFKSFPARLVTNSYDSVDFTMSVKDLITLLKNANLLATQEDIELLLSCAEKHYDPEETYTITEVVELKKGAPLPPTIPQDVKEQRLSNLLNSEIIYVEFAEILRLYLFRKDGLTIRESEIQERFSSAIEKLEILAKVAQDDELKKDDVVPEISWPQTEKDNMSQNLNKLKEERERELALLKQKKIERENEERENKLMKLEDRDITDAMIKPKTRSKKSVSESLESSIDDFLMD